MSRTPASPVRTRTRRSASATLAGAVLLLGACGSDASTGAPAGGGDGQLSVVASTDVYADVARSIAGEHAEVSAIIDDPAQDPHSYEATTRDRLALERAQVVVTNGGGYDPFVETVLAAADTEGTTVITAVDLFAGATGEAHADEAHADEAHADEAHADEAHADEAHADEAHDHGAFNEHVWYDLATVQRVADELVAALSAAAPEHAADFEANGAAFEEDVTALLEQQERIRATVAGRPVAVTEPVPVHMLAALGLEDRTPAAFGEAMEEGNDVPPAVMHEVLQLVGDGQVAALVYNEQTSGPQTEQVAEAARAAGVPVVPVTETLPEGEDYTTWMSANLDALAGAVGA